MNHKDDCRTALATPGLLIICMKKFQDDGDWYNDPCKHLLQKSKILYQKLVTGDTDLWQVTHDTDMCTVTRDTWKITCDTWQTGDGEHCVKIWGP